MHVATRPWASTGIALLSAAVIAAPAAAPQVSVAQVHVPAIDLQASVLDIFTFPAARQYIQNQILGYAVLAAGFADAGVAIGQAAAALPQTIVTWAQQVFSGDLLGSLTTVENYIIGSAAAIGGPVLKAYITNNQRPLAVQSALWVAVPQASYLGGKGVYELFDGVTRALITAGQEVWTAIKSLNFTNIVNAAVAGVQNVIASVGTGAQNVVDGIVAAQDTLAKAFAIYPTIPPAAAVKPAASVSSVASLPKPAASAATVSADPEPATSTAGNKTRTTSNETAAQTHSKASDSAGGSAHESVGSSRRGGDAN